MSKKILFITDNFPPETNAPASRTYEHALVWKELGYDITIITCQPNFPRGKVYKGYKNKFISKEVYDGLKIIRVWSFMAENSGFVLRVIDHISFAFMASMVSLFFKRDVVITTSPQFFTNFVGVIYKLIRRKPWIIEIRDIWPESLRAVGSLKNDFIYKTLEKIEIFFYKYSSKVIVVTDSFKNQLIQRGITPEKISIVKNAVNTDFFNTKNLISTHTFPKDKKIVGYLGTMGMAHNLNFILDAAKELKESKYHFVLIGDGAEKKNLAIRAEELGLKNVSFYDGVTKKEVPSILSQFDFGLINLKPSDTFKSVIPSKMFELSAMQVPILNGVEGEAQRMITDAQIGFNYDPRMPQSLIDQLKLLDGNAELKTSIKKNQISFARLHSRRNRATEMIEYIMNVKDFR